MNIAKGVVIAGLSGGSGKSVVSVGITALLAREHVVVPFKKGPDYIDAGWMQLAAGRKCYNLDPYLMEPEVLKRSFVHRAKGADYFVVEGNRGLYDGVDVTGGYSSAELAVMLDLPVILVVNCTKTTRTIAAMVLGCREFDSRLKICGVVLNQVATERQKKLIVKAVEHYTGIPVVGAIPRLKKDIFPMRHLGMVPHQEYRNSSGALAELAELAENNIDLKKIKSLMLSGISGEKGIGPCTVKTAEEKSATKIAKKITVGVLQDAAFQFYYSENLEALQAHGAELVYINAMDDHELMAVDGLYIGGGFPETGARELAANTGFKNSLKEKIEKGLPVYAECGGLIYLGESLEVDGEEFSLAGIFPARFSMSAKPQAHGYSIFVSDSEACFYRPGTRVKGHEFRYSRVIEWRGAESSLTVEMQRGKGFINGRDGLVYKNVFALYTHVHAEGTPEWAPRFIERCVEYKADQEGEENSFQ